MGRGDSRAISVRERMDGMSYGNSTLSTLYTLYVLSDFTMKNHWRFGHLTTSLLSLFSFSLYLSLSLVFPVPYISACISQNIQISGFRFLSLKVLFVCTCTRFV